MATFSSDSLPEENLGFVFFKSNFELSSGKHTLTLTESISFPDVSIMANSITSGSTVLTNQIIPITLKKIVDSGNLDFSVTVKVINNLELEVDIPIGGTYTIAVK